MARGRCLCGAVEFSVEPPYRWMAYCHCSMCRKHHGALFSTSVGVSRQRYRLLAGADCIVPYRATAAFVRAFCNRCGAKVPAASQRTDVINVPAGLLEDLEGMQPRAHIFVGSRSPHVTLDNVLPRYETYPPSVNLPAVTWPPPTRQPPVPRAARGGTSAGSCLCQAVAYEVEGDLLGVAHCHCAGCRLSSGSAHATTAVAPARRLRWTRGENLVVRYAQSGAPPSRSAFCGRCGSLMPAVAPGCSTALIPAGSLDTPLPEPSCHVHVDSKAPWYDIHDALPRCAGEPPWGALESWSCAHQTP